MMLRLCISVKVVLPHFLVVTIKNIKYILIEIHLADVSVLVDEHFIICQAGCMRDQLFNTKSGQRF
jgi:hypothetical protein